MSVNQLRQKNLSELQEQLLELRREQFNLRMQRSAGQLTQTHQVGKVRREIARIKTVLGQKKNEASA